MKRWFLRHLPLALILVVVWSITRVRINVEHFFGFNQAGLLLTCICFVVLVVEFFKSGDISLRSFEWDQIFSVIATLIFPVVITTVILEKIGLHVTDVLMFGLVIADAIVSPINSFRTAQRNWEAKIGSGPG